MNSLNNQTDNNKWFDVSFVDAKGGERSCWTNRDDLKLDFSESFYQRSSKYFDPITPQTVVSIDSVNQVKPGDTTLVNDNMTALRNLVETLMDDCGMEKITKISEIEEVELWKIYGLLDLVINSANSIKDEIDKQQDYLEVSARSELLSKL